jgi:hypothetical protein
MRPAQGSLAKGRMLVVSPVKNEKNNWRLSTAVKAAKPVAGGYGKASAGTARVTRWSVVSSRAFQAGCGTCIAGGAAK